MREKKNKISKALLTVVIYSMVIVVLGAASKAIFNAYMVSNTVLLVGMITLVIAFVAFILKLKTRKAQ